MVYVFIPEYHTASTGFEKSLRCQTVGNVVIRCDRKSRGIYWTKAVENFRKEARSYRGVKEEDTICIMNNDIAFSADFLAEGSNVRRGEIYAPEFVKIDWWRKQFIPTKLPGEADTFAGRAFFMTYADFVNSKFCSLLPHYLSDYDYGIKMLKKLTPRVMMQKITHEDHLKVKGFKMHSVNNPFFWTIFLLRHFNIYTPINIIKSWIDAVRNKND